MKPFLSLALSLTLSFLSPLTIGQSSTAMKNIDAASLASFAPTGTLRVGINLGNPILANEDQNTKVLSGVTIDIANEIGKRISRPVKLVPFKTAGTTVDAVKTGDIDMVFVAIDPVRGADIVAPWVGLIQMVILPLACPFAPSRSPKIVSHMKLLSPWVLVPALPMTRMQAKNGMSAALNPPF
jgi:ABC-type amino acid transport substrate-binding protein